MRTVAMRVQETLTRMLGESREPWTEEQINDTRKLLQHRIQADADAARFVVTQDGAASTSDVFGPFVSLDEAKVRADECAGDPKDDGYHDYRVRVMSPRGGLSGVVYSAARKKEARSVGSPHYDAGDRAWDEGYALGFSL